MSESFAGRLLETPEGPLDFPEIEVENGHIVSLRAGVPGDADEVFTPALLDVHNHGAMGHDFMRARPEEMAVVSRFLATRGVAHYLPTTVTAAPEPTLQALAALGRFLRRPVAPDEATPVGIHLEGPFLCAAKRGVHPEGLLQAPSIPLFDRMQEAAEGCIRLVTLAPEVPGALDLIRHLTAQGVRVSLGHSNATAAEALLAIEAGAVSATHTFNAMRPLDHREPGIVGVVLDSPALFAEAIVDGIHVDPLMVRLWFRMKGEARALLVTDGMSATGMPEGTYRLGDLTVEVRDGMCLADGVLAGSVLTLDKAVENFRSFTGADLRTATRLASANPACMLGMEHLATLRVGAPASFNVYDSHGRRKAIVLRGRRFEAA